MKYVMGIDHGGTSMKAVLFDIRGREIASAHRSTPMLTPKPGFTERDMENLWIKNCETVKETIEKSGVDAADIVGISFSGHGKGLYLWGKDGRPARAGIVSTDSRAYKIVEKWTEDGTAARAYPLTCQKTLACQPVALISWIMENEPGVIENTQYIFGIKDYVRFRMTGVAKAEITDFSGSSLVNVNTASYDDEILKIYGLECVRDKLPELVYSSSFCGKVTAECAALTGLKEGTPVAAGLFDIDACAIGMNVVDDSRIAVIAGTWAINEYLSRKPVTNGTVQMNSRYALKEYFLCEECSPTSASNYDWFLNNFMQEAAKESGKNIYELCNAMVDGVAPDRQSIMFLPYLFGGTDDPRTKSVLLGLEAWHGREDVLRAVCEGVVYGHRRQVERLQNSRAEKAKAVRLAGGVVRASGWVQMFADILGLNVETIDVDELGALGAAMTAAVAAGEYADLRSAAAEMVRVDKVYTPNPEYKEIYDKKYEKYLKVEQDMQRLFADLEENA